MQPEFRVLPWNEEVIASRSLSGTCRAIKGTGLAALESTAPYGAPASDQLVRSATCRGEKPPALAEGKLVSSTEVKDIANVEVSQAIVSLDAPTRYIGRTVSAHTPI